MASTQKACIGENCGTADPNDFDFKKSKSLCVSCWRKKQNDYQRERRTKKRLATEAGASPSGSHRSKQVRQDPSEKIPEEEAPQPSSQVENGANPVIDVLEKGISVLKEQAKNLAELQKHNAELQQQVATLTSKCDALQKHNAELQQQVATLKTQLDELPTNIVKDVKESAEYQEFNEALGQSESATVTE
jgi:uncharacterized protein YoxC